MGGKILFLIPFIAIVEIFLIVKIGGAIGFLPTVSIVLCTGMTGVWLLRQQGFKLITQLNNRLNQGQLPATELLEGVALMIGGVMLVTPGFLTDISGFCLLLPWTRKMLISRLSSVLEKQIQSGSNVTYYQGGFGAGYGRDDRPDENRSDNVSGAGGKHIYEGEFTQVEEPEDNNSEKK